MIASNVHFFKIILYIQMSLDDHECESNPRENKTNKRLRNLDVIPS